MSIIIVTSQEGMRQMMMEPAYSEMEFKDGSTRMVVDLKQSRTDGSITTVWENAIRLMGVLHVQSYVLEVALLQEGTAKVLGQWTISVRDTRSDNQGT